MAKLKGLLIVSTFCLFAINVMAKDLGSFGATYEVKEKDFLGEIKKRAEETDWDAAINKARERVKKNVGVARKQFPPATEDNSYLVDLTYTLDHDIHKYDTNGQQIGLLYPKGFTYNVLEYVQNPEIYVFFNGESMDEIEYFQKHYGDNMLAFPIITAGNVFDVAEIIKRPVFIIPDEMEKRFHITKTLSVAYQEGVMLRVDEVRVPVVLDENKQARIVPKSQKSKWVITTPDGK